MQSHLAAQRLDEGEHVARAFDVDAVGGVVTHVHVVHGRQMEDMLHLADQLLQLGGTDQVCLGHVAREPHERAGQAGKAALQRLELGL